MKSILWSADKNEQLIKQRQVSFEEVVFWINNGGLVDIVKHPSPKYGHQRIFVVIINDYAYLVPFVEEEDHLFLKTIIPSRKATKKYVP